MVKTSSPRKSRQSRAKAAKGSPLTESREPPFAENSIPEPPTIDETSSAATRKSHQPKSKPLPIAAKAGGTRKSKRVEGISAPAVEVAASAKPTTPTASAKGKTNGKRKAPQRPVSSSSSSDAEDDEPPRMAPPQKADPGPKPATLMEMARLGSKRDAVKTGDSDDFERGYVGPSQRTVSLTPLRSV